MDRLGQSIRRRKRREGSQFSVLFPDLDRFKLVNDGLGHTAGDQLLVAIARRLESRLRPGNSITRLGGDEFTVLLAVATAERIQRELSSPFELNGHSVYTTASIGMALGAAGYDKPEEILRDADTAMCRAKERGKSCHEIFDLAMHARAATLLRLETDLRQALYQPSYLWIRAG